MAIDGAVIVQTGRHFAVAEAHVGRGGIIHFINSDDFSHQIYIDSPDFTFESDEQEPGTTISVTFTRAGVFAVRCHIHPKMHLQVTVSDPG
jgi:plastocyanin